MLLPEIKGRLLIGICSCRKNSAKRRAVNETWFPRGIPGVQAKFFVGRGESLRGESDTIALDVCDDYAHLPAKTRAFFRYALDNLQFDWLFKCDDDTYLSVERLMLMTIGSYDVIGNEFLEKRGSASGGAGYLLSRRIVKLLAEDDSLPATGDEDVILTGTAVARGALCSATTRLCFDRSRPPKRENDSVSCHWVGPDAMRAIHFNFTKIPEATFHAKHHVWSDKLHVYRDGSFSRDSVPHGGTWKRENGGALRLNWFEFNPEMFRFDREQSGQPPLCEVKDIGVILIATGRYRKFVSSAVRGIRSNFLPMHRRTMFLFTDGGFPGTNDVNVIPIEHQRWPGPTLFRYATISKHSAAFRDMEYLFYLDIDTRVEGLVGEEVLGELIAVRHPGYYECRREQYPYEKNPASTAYIPENEGSAYYCGAFQGGKREVYLQAVETMRAAISSDCQHEIVAEWHDESHWNRFLVDAPTLKVLSPSYCCPEGASYADTKIIALNKDHAGLRQSGPTDMPPAKIVASLLGGLGNQMFQYAHALSLARRCGASLELVYDDNQHAFALGHFGIAVSSGSRQSPVPNVTDYSGYREGMEDEIYRAVLNADSPEVIIRGYFQNERFFSSVADELRATFALPPVLPMEAHGRTPVCVQVRRGDYVGLPTHNVCGVEYFRSSMRIMRALVADPLFLIVSDDLSWCRNHIMDGEDIFVPTVQTELEGFRTMLACHALIISNSTYGWWGAWLSQAKSVIAPNRFLNDQPWAIVPKTWIQIPPEGVAHAARRTPLSLECTAKGPIDCYLETYGHQTCR